MEIISFGFRAEKNQDKNLHKLREQPYGNILASTNHKQENVGTSGISSLIEDANRMFKLRFKRRKLQGFNISLRDKPQSSAFYAK